MKLRFFGRSSAALLAAAFLTAAPPAAAGDTTLSFDVAPFLRTDDFRWNIAGDSDGSNPNVLSELTWRDIKIQGVRAAGEIRRARAFVLQAAWSGGRVTDGQNQDSDYAGDFRSFEFSRSNNRADMGDTRDMLLSAGFPMDAPLKVDFVPMAGWTYASERLFMTQGNQTVNVLSFSPYIQGQTGPFQGLNSHYAHRWRGFWLGFQSAVKVSPGLEASGIVRYQPRLQYYGEADWNLRTDFSHPKSYEHTARGKGWDVGLSMLYEATPSLSWGVGLDWRRWKASNGKDTVFFWDGTTGETRLNEVRWDAFSFTITARFRFFSEGEDRRFPEEREEGPF